MRKAKLRLIPGTTRQEGNPKLEKELGSHFIIELIDCAPDNIPWQDRVEVEPRSEDWHNMFRFPDECLSA